MRRKYIIIRKSRKNTDPHDGNSISLAAQTSRNVIALATSLHGIGPMIVDGTFRKKMVEMEPPWHCPKDFSLVPVKMPDFSMELLIDHRHLPEKTNRINKANEVNKTNGVKDAAGPEETFLPEGRVVLQLHGGGYIGKIRNAYRDFAVLYAGMQGISAALSVDYRVAPEDPYPAALKDAAAAYRWLLSMGIPGEKIILAGDSAGGGLALALALYLKDNGEPLPWKMVLMSPWTDLAASGESYQTNFEKDPLFGNTRESLIYNDAYYNGHDVRDPYISPLYGNFEGLPPMLFQVGGTEMLLSDSTEAADRAKKAGCAVTLSVYGGMFHVFQLGMKKMKESREAWKEVEAFLSDKN